MKLGVSRTTCDGQCTMGTLTIEGTDRRWFTLEPPARQVKPRAIPAGTYKLTLRWSPRFERMMPHVEDVPDFAGVLIHWGNFPKDTEGCLLVGRIAHADFVGDSRKAFDELNGLLVTASQMGEKFEIEYKDPQ